MRLLEIKTSKAKRRSFKMPVIPWESEKAGLKLSIQKTIVQLSHTYMTTGINHSFDWMDLCQQSNVSAF